MRTTLLTQISDRRKSMGVRTSDMPTLAGINRQQYEKIEKGGNPSLATLDRIVEGLDAELLLVPKEHINQVRELLGKLRRIRNLEAHPAVGTAHGFGNAQVIQGKPSTDTEDDKIDGVWAEILSERGKL